MTIQINHVSYLYLQIVLNAALGFDTFLVMRHGVRATSYDVTTSNADSDVAMTSNDVTGSTTSVMATTLATTSNLGGTINGCDLGCYFCNDVVAPGDVSKAEIKALKLYYLKIILYLLRYVACFCTICNFLIRALIHFTKNGVLRCYSTRIF